MSIIGISGRIGSGKDTVGEIIQKICLTNGGPKFEIKKFAGKLKTIASLLTGIPVENFENQEFKKLEMSNEWSIGYGKKLDGTYTNILPMTYREFLQKLGTEAMRDGLHTNVWVNALFSDYIPVVKEWDEFGNDTIVEYPSWCITDMRFPNEMEAVKERGGITVRVVRPGTKDYFQLKNRDGSITHATLHPSETALDNAEFDYEIINDAGIPELIEKVRTILIKENII